jgi:protein TonB
MIAITFLSMRAALGRGSTDTEAPHASLIWLIQQPAPDDPGGGGGGGNKMATPLQRVERRGNDARTLPVGPAPAIDPSRQVRPDVEPVPRVDIPAIPLADGTQMLPGSIDAPAAPPSPSLGPGTDGGAGTGRRGGDGPGDGPGLRAGWNGGTGGDAYQIGGDVSPPIEIRRGAPQYTTAAMQSRAQGTILVECVVQTTGICTNIRVKRSFNPPFGLDEQAMKAAAEWRFRPAMRRGQPVPVVVTMEIAFALR